MAGKAWQGEVAGHTASSVSKQGETSAGAQMISPSHSVQRLSPRAGAGNTHGVRYQLSYSSRDSLFQVCPEVCPEEIRDPVKTTITINHPVAEEWLGEGTLPVLEIGV